MSSGGRDHRSGRWPHREGNGIFIGNSTYAVLATHGGFVELLVKLNDKVEAGQRVAIQRNTFGESSRNIPVG